jgi:hypothetical protein
MIEPVGILEKTQNIFPLLQHLLENQKQLYFALMKFALAIAVFGLFAFFISWGIIEVLKGSPWLLLAALAVFFGTFVKYGCRSH